MATSAAAGNVRILSEDALWWLEAADLQVFLSSEGGCLLDPKPAKDRARSILSEAGFLIQAESPQMIALTFNGADAGPEHCAGSVSFDVYIYTLRDESEGWSPENQTIIATIYLSSERVVGPKAEFAPQAEKAVADLTRRFTEEWRRLRDAQD